MSQKFIAESIEFKQIRKTHKTLLNGEDVLRGKGTKMLKLLLSNTNKLVSFNTIMEEVWGLHDWDYFNIRCMDVYLTKIRKTLSRYDNVSIERVDYNLILKIV